VRKRIYLGAGPLRYGVTDQIGAQSPPLPIFTDLAMPLDVKLVAVKSFPGGIVVHNYQPA